MMSRRSALGALSLGLLGHAGSSIARDLPKESRGSSEKSTRKALRPALPAPSAKLKPDDRIVRILKEARTKHRLPGMIGGVVLGKDLAAIGSVGVRKIGSEEPMTVRDVVHLGSDTKAMTATLLATFVDEGHLSWSSTIRDVFSSRAGSFHPDFQKVTLLQLLTHRAGLPANGPWWELKGKTTTEKRYDLLGRMLKNSPQSKPGSTFAYSNVGYAIAGLMAEETAKKSWERLMEERLFDPLEMPTAGFGPPGKRGTLDEPWGHTDKGEPSQGDNPPALGPAGTVHCSLADWAKFIALHIRGTDGKAKLLKASTFKILHTPPGGSEYACGWGVVDRGWAGGKALTHDGSNTMWHCSAWVAPARDFAVLAVTNQGGDGAATGCSEAVNSMVLYALALSKGRNRSQG